MREASSADLPLLTEWNRQLIQDQRSSNPMSQAALDARMRGWLAAEYRAVLFEIGPEPVAYAVFRPAEGGIHLRQFFVARDRRRQGIGRRAIAAFRQRYVPPGTALMLEVLAHNRTGLAFWRALGFQEHALTLRLPPSLPGQLRPATSRDLPALCALLAAAKLPEAGVAEHLGGFVVCESAGSIIGVGGLERFGSVALLRSLAVAPEHQRRGVAVAICDRLEAEAASCGVEEIYLLTETAERFFAKRGYAVTPRASAPPEIASSEEFSRICPRSAVLMRRSPREPA